MQSHGDIWWITWRANPGGVTMSAHVRAVNTDMTLCGISIGPGPRPASLSIPPCRICSERLREQMQLNG